MIILNGKRYDASTGKQLSESPQSQIDNPTIGHPPKKNIPSSSAQTIDGFTKRKVARTSVRSARKPEKSKTLMRGSVRRPKTNHSTKNVKTTSKKKTITNPSAHVDPVRELRATEAKRSGLISKFGEVKNKVKFASVPVVEPPKPDTPKLSNKSPEHLAQSSQEAYPNRFDGVLEAANSHKQSKAKKDNKRAKLAHKLRISPKLMNITLVLMIGTVIGGYVAYNNVPNLAMQIAATRSGVDAEIPEYQPAGFAIKGPIQYKPGHISINFGSNSDQRSYVVSQSKSEWNSETLLENHVATNNRAYQTLQEKGKTIYLYDGDNASWVDNGIWYEIDGNSALSSDQIMRIANSL